MVDGTLVWLQLPCHVRPSAPPSRQPELVQSNPIRCLEDPALSSLTAAITVAWLSRKVTHSTATHTLCHCLCASDKCTSFADAVSTLEAVCLGTQDQRELWHVDILLSLFRFRLNLSPSFEPPVVGNRVCLVKRCSHLAH